MNTLSKIIPHGHLAMKSLSKITSHGLSAIENVWECLLGVAEVCETSRGARGENEGQVADGEQLRDRADDAETRPEHEPATAVTPHSTETTMVAINIEVGSDGLLVVLTLH